MMIKFSDIPEDSLELKGTLEDTWVRDMLSHLKPKTFTFSGTAQRMDKSMVVLRGNFEGRLEFPCDRCLDPFDLSVSDPRLDCLIQLKPDVSDENSPENQEDSTHWCARPEFNLGEVVGEYVNLAIPFKRLCQPQCLGLCQGCGANLNIESCHCESDSKLDAKNNEESPTNRPFAVLKTIRDLCKKKTSVL